MSATARTTARHGGRDRPPRPAAAPRALAGAVALALGAALVGCGALPGSGAPLHPVVTHEFAQPLAIPPLAPSRLEDGVRVFALEARSGERSFAPATAPGASTPTWGFDGDFLGPTLRAVRGEDVAVEVENGLPEATSVHWHGMHLPAAMDGGPHQEIPAGGSWRPAWTIDQPAATLWYHPHPHGATETHVLRGLAGMFILDDDRTATAALPSEYGVDDVPVIVQDRRFADDGGFVLSGDGAEPGLLGDTVLVNGTVGPVHEVRRERTRLRLLNASTARSYRFALPDRPLTMIAGDGGLLDAPLPLDAIQLSPGERAEVIVEMRAGETLRLRSEAVELGGVLLPGASGGGDAFDVLELRAAETLEPSPEPTWEPSAHAEADALHETDAVETREFELNGREINGERMDLGRVDAAVELGATELWAVRSTQAIPHSFHVHDVQFRILSVDGAPPPPELAGRKDTVLLEPQRRYLLLMRFDDYADPDHPYMFHCHMLLHEDEGMMGQFVVVESGSGARAEAGLDAPEHAH
ncbi:multicopper oxidase domain-containing protein [Leucobacter allii]|uniref:Multicopper oxidase domain-containing protein n=1 Tax=Leucobacter allii TaxID=2932247 RepID=A0ABY4FMY3_9MICO|nr:multicopper oxidase domain-containing protein [Leucobacter allii]UOQ57632.1 multicopper oxidase domain-containing protein [Leucobacter allii]